MRKLIALAALAVSVSAYAGEGFNGSVALTSNYVWRGVTQTTDRPSVEGDIYYEFKGGPYAGQTFGTVHYVDDPAYLESSSYIGMSHSLWTDDVTLDVRATQYTYPAAHNHDYPEILFLLTWKGLSGTFVYTDDYFHEGIPGYYGEVAYNYDFPQDWSVGGSSGYFAKKDEEGNYWNGKAYVNKRYKGVKFELAVTGTHGRTHAPEDHAGHTRAVFTVSKDFGA